MMALTGYTWVIEGDVKACFDEISQGDAGVHQGEGDERDGDQYVHSNESDTWDEVHANFPGAPNPEVTRRMCHILNGTAKKYCVFFDNADATGTVCVVDLSDPSRVGDLSGDAARHMPMYTMIETAQALLDEEAKTEAVAQ